MKVKGRKITAIFVVAMITLLSSGCNDSVQTQEEIVVPKQEEGEEIETSGKEIDELKAQDTDIGEIAEQVNAPENYVWEGSSGNISVKVNAPVVIPQGEGFKTYRVTARPYTQEDYDKVSKALFKGATLWERDYEQMEKSNGFTKEEIEERIVRFEERKAEGGKYEDAGKNISYDDLIETWETMKEEAPEEAAIVDVPAVISYTESDEYLEENILSGCVTVDGLDYYVSVDNNLRDDWRWVTFEVKAQRDNASYTPVGEGDESDLEIDKFPRQELKKEAEKLIEDMGFSDFAATGDEFFQTYAWNEELNAFSEDNKDGYGVHFTRTPDGIPVTYTYSDGTSMEDDALSAWPYEGLDIIYDMEGIADFKWTNPYKIEKLSDETVFLIPFSDIENIFEEMFLKKYGDFFEESEVSFEIKEVRLGYMRIMEKGNVMEGTMVPVWDFFGTETITQNENEIYTYGGPYASWLTINAMDGTIIDRDLGY